MIYILVAFLHAQPPTLATPKAYPTKAACELELAILAASANTTSYRCVKVKL